MAKDITETHSVLVGEAVGRAKINVQTRQRIPHHGGKHPVAMPRSAGLETSGFPADPTGFHSHGRFLNNVNIDIGFCGKAGHGCAADMLEAFCPTTP
ncbi:hypothetical protein WKI41_11820 [Agrobacterium larrymoorei]